MYRDAEDGLDVALGPDLPADRRDELLSLERLLQLDRGSRALERERALRRERLEPRHLRRRKGAALASTRGGENGDDPVSRHQGDEDGALRPDALREAAVHPGRRLNVVDRDRSDLECGARECGWLVLQIDDDRRPPIGVALAARAEASRLLPVLADQRDRSELDPEEAHDLIEENAGDRLRVLRVREARRERGAIRVGLRRRRRLGLTCFVRSITAATVHEQQAEGEQ